MLKESNDDVDLEDGELSVSSDEVYTPLQRPRPLLVDAAKEMPSSTSQQQLVDDDEDEEEEKLSSGSDSDAISKKVGIEKRNRKRTMMVRLPPTESNQRARFKRYNVWNEAMQEDTLTETLRGCDVKIPVNDRNVENYDYTLKFRLNGENTLKRRFSTSTDDVSDSGEHQQSSAKRGRLSSTHDNVKRRGSVKNRLGQRERSSSGRRHKSGSSGTSGSDNSDRPNLIAELRYNILDLEIVEVAREIADKLCEEKADLMVRIVETLGKEIPIEIFNETRRIEADGGMMIKNRQRRRTPGGVFLFLLKNDERLTDDIKKTIFREESQNDSKRRKDEKTLARDRKVQELKKRLNEQKPELPALHKRADLLLLGNELNIKNKPHLANLSNPPPSPVGHEPSPDFRAQDIVGGGAEINQHKLKDLNLISVPAPDVMPTTSKILLSYDDDFLDVNCTDMDFS